MKIYWVGDRGFIEIDGNELKGVAEVKATEKKLEVKITVERIEHDCKQSEFRSSPYNEGGQEHPGD